MICRIGVIYLAASLRTLIGIRSGPHAFLGLNLVSSFSIPSVVNVIFGIVDNGLVPLSGTTLVFSLVNADWYWLLRASALALLLVARPPSVFRIGMPLLSFFWLLINCQNLHHRHILTLPRRLIYASHPLPPKP